MTRLERVTTLMEPGIERKNKAALLRLLPEFFYSGATNTRIKKSLNPLTRDFKHIDGDKFFNVGSDLRAWYKVGMHADIDLAYQRYRNFLSNVNHPLVSDYNLTDYEVFRAKRVYIPEKKQEIRLFKFIINNGILSQDQVDFINEISNNKDLYFVVSRNPLDILFCSTDQAYSSCLSIDSDLKYCYGLLSGTLDPALAIGYFTDGTLYQHEIKNCYFMHFRYQQRQFIHICKRSRVRIDAVYPCMRFSMKDFLAELGFIDTYEGYRTPMEAPWAFIRPLFVDRKTTALPYRDHHGLKIVKKNGKTYAKSHETGQTGSWFDFPGMPFRQAYEFEDLLEPGASCHNCGDSIHEDEINPLDDGVYCNDCFNDLFFHCEGCEEHHDRSEAVYIHGDDIYICGYCFGNHYFQCDHCGSCFSDDYAESIDSDTVCTGCFEDYFDEECHICRDEIHFDDINTMYNGKPACKDCIESQLIKVYLTLPRGTLAIRDNAEIKIYKQLLSA